MKKKAIVSLFAACAILLAGCGGSDGGAPTSAPESGAPAAQSASSGGGAAASSAAAPSGTDKQAAAPAAQSDSEFFVGLWQYMEDDVWLGVFDDGTWILYNQLGGHVDSGSWAQDGSSMLLYHEDGSYYKTLEIDMTDNLWDSDAGSTLYQVPEIPSIQTESNYPLDFYCGLWEYMEDAVWLGVFEDNTWILYNELGGHVDGGTWALDGDSMLLYHEDGSYFKTLEVDMTDNLYDSDADSVLYQVPGIPDTEPLDEGLTYAEDIAILPGVWYPDGQLDAESYLYFTADGEWTMYQRAPGKEPWVAYEGDIVSAMGEEHAYYAKNDQSEFGFYFQIIPASESGIGAPEILWDNGSDVYILCE